ncbi:hypothetical protein N9948_00045 [bacterium]|nr:hypothetical protein [bacterium]
MRVLLIDDLRTWGTEKIKKLNLPKGTIAKNYASGITELKKGNWDMLLLDHDLGEEKDGMNILEWLEEEAIKSQKFIPKKIIIVTDNAAERNRMKNLSNRLTNVKEMDKFRERFSKVIKNLNIPMGNPLIKG